MGVQERRAREKQELRQEILAAARDLFINEGFENVSMRKIAEKIEYSPTTIYLYFQDKADLLDCICEETLLRLHERMAAIRDEYPAPIDRMHHGLRAYIKFGLEYPSDYRVAFMMEFKEFAESGRNMRCQAMGNVVFDNFRKDIIEGIRTGVFAPRDAEAVSQAIWAAIHGMTSLLIVRCNFPWVEQNLLIDTLIDTLLEGFKVPQLQPTGV
jgi:AcrR family transcriptional regulator